MAEDQGATADVQEIVAAFNTTADELELELRQIFSEYERILSKETGGQSA